MNKTCVLYCSCEAGIFPEKESGQLTKALNNLQLDIYELHDLCALSINEKEFLRSIGKEYDQKIIIACFPRAIKNILKQGDIDFGKYEVINFREESVKEITNKLDNQFNLPAGNANYQIKESQLKVPAWFPVIDHSLCTLCGQCSRFCLFGVYKFNKKSLTVIDPLACKDNCPACGRTCPTSAIIFPRLMESSVLSGAELNDRERQKPIGNGSLFVLLNERNNTRKNIFRQGFIKQAEEERNKAIEDLKKEFNKKK